MTADQAQREAQAQEERRIDAALRKKLNFFGLPWTQFPASRQAELEAELDLLEAETEALLSSDPRH